ncbi:hypothetical protein LEN26_013471 [Aphanomyces euteiches]|nr:hypothetical protein LEN26_013471 [Aphanomyces euteiches]KAH9124212.1 hypothetical protein AeMF1_004992 [Aphanomyces euteiches]
MSDPAVQTEDASLLHGGQTNPSNNNRVKYIALGVAAAAAVGVGIYFLAKPSSSVQLIAPSSQGEGNPSTSTTNTPSTNAPASGSTTSTDSPVASTPSAAIPTSDPEAMTPALTFLAIGDWGSTTGKEAGVPGSCCRLYQGQVDTSKPRYKVDYYAQSYVSNILAQSATQLKPVRIIGHGDNFYWNGVGPNDVKYRFAETFEKMYADPVFNGIKWLNVVGNHDLGGSAYICGDQDNQFRECTSKDELISSLRNRFNLQASYKSPNQDRWVMKDHYYVERVTKDGVTVDVFNLDTNHADAHGAQQTCCQCFGYSAKLGVDNSKCESATRNDATCMGGNQDWFDACMAEIEAWGQDSYTQALRDIKASTADYKIINTHYSPHHHMNPQRMQKWYQLTKDTGVHVWFNGHTHGFGHDIATWGTHFFENGGGGGIRTDSDSATDNGFVKTAWVAGGTPYGFMELSFSKDWLKVQFVTFDNKWQFGGMDLKSTVTGGLQRGHCWYIPSGNASASYAGKECKSSVNTAIGAPLR